MGPSEGITSELSINPRCSTPATITGFPLSVMVLPTIPGSELNSRFHRFSLMIATAALPGLSSSGSSRRPSSGLAPSMCSRLDCPRMASTRSGRSRPVRVRLRLCARAIASKEWFSVCKSIYWPGDGQSRMMPIPGECSQMAARRSACG